MTSEHKNEEAIFDAALEIKDAAERSAYLKSACGRDAELLARVEALLKVHYEDKNFLESLPVGVTFDDSPLTEGPGTKIGRYKLLELIGEGGFGVVYMAEQREPIRRRVALKIIKLGMDTKQVIARFEAERQALAMMEHPNIAKVLDAGATETGRPYFVMELVKGISVTEYCDKNNLDTRQRLEIFIDICKAVQHAHQKGIIHRDIKPTNVLITLRDDDSPVPKIIDFGIAKATQAQLTEKTLFTEFKQFIGTPEYMSPEQARMGEFDVDTRSDIYPLGVLLYELLTGTTPFDAKKLRSAAFDEVVRIIREEEPPRPSSSLNTLGEALSSVAKHRQVEPGQLCKIISGDLDWIVLKTLEKDRRRRYETANELAQDIQRHLADEPVVAGPPSPVYRVKKFVRRNRKTVTAAAIVLAAIVAGLVVSTAMYFQAEQAWKKEAIARIEVEQAREKEAIARLQAEQAEGIAQGQRQRAERLLARAQLERGVKLLNEGNCEGLLDLLEARTTADEIPDLRDAASRLWAIAHDLWSGRLFHMLSRSDYGDLAFSPDGKLLASAQARGAKGWIKISGTTAQLWDTATGQPHGPPLPLDHIVSTVVFSPDGRLLAVHSVEGVTRLWDTTAGQAVGPVLGRGEGTGKSPGILTQWLGMAYWSAAFSPDGKLLATASLDGTVRLWEIETGRPYVEPLRHESRVWSVAFSPDGKLLASGTDSTAHLWEVSSGRPHGLPLETDESGSEERRTKVVFSPDGKLLATLEGATVGLWETGTGQLHKRLRAQHQDVVVSQDVAFSPDGKLLATAGDWMAQVWDTATGKAQGEELRHEGLVRCVAFSPDGKLLATGGDDGTVRLWEVSSKKPYGQPLLHQDSVSRTIFSPDGQFLASSASGPTRIWRTYQPFCTEVLPYQSGVQLGDISPDGKVGAIISGDKVHLWNTRTGKVLGEPLRHKGRVVDAAFSPNGKLLASAVGHIAIQLWDVATWQAFGQSIKCRGGALTMSFSPDGKLLAAGIDRTWTADVFEVITGRQLHSLPCNGRDVSVAFSPDGRILATSSLDGIAKLWEVDTGRLLSHSSPLKHSDGLYAVAYSPDGNLLATASGEDVITLWDVSVRPPYYSLVMPGHTFSARAGTLESFSKDGTLLVRRLPEKKARVWCLPLVPTDLREMQLRTWIAVGSQQNNQGVVTAIPWRQWQKLREELHSLFGEAEKGDEYYVPIGPEPDLKEEELLRLETLEIQHRVLGEEHLNANTSYQMALLQLYTGDIEGYYNTCNQIFAHFGESEKPEDVHWVVWTCVLAPNAVEDLSQVVKLAKQLVNSNDKNEQYLRTLGATFYRAGQFEGAIDKLTKLANAWEETGQYPIRSSPAYTWYFLAMAHHQSGNINESLKYYNKAVKWAEQEIADNAIWNRRLTLQLLRTEAQLLLAEEQE
jgi:WD40 repeat protein/serine/threonine protein kinase